MDSYSKMTTPVPSQVPVDVVIPAIPKDFPVLPHVVASVRQFLRHPLGDIIVVAPANDQLTDYCRRAGIRLLDERRILPLSRENIDYVYRGMDRSGWLYQQLLKLNGDEYCRQEHFVVMDADTVLIRDCSFCYYDKMIFRYSDEYHKPYFDTYAKLLKLNRRMPVSFVAHQMIFHKPKLREMKKMIELVTRTTWYQAIVAAIDRNEISCFSEYETYANYVLFHYPDAAIIEYWNNLGLKQGMIQELPSLIQRYADHYRSLSFHTYL